MKKVLTVIASLMLSATLLLGGVGSALAEDTAECCGLFGTVLSVDIDSQGDGSISVENVKGAEGTGDLTVTCDNSTTYHIPTYRPPWQTWTQWADSEVDLESYLAEGARIAVLLTEPLTDDTVDPVAAKVMVIPAKAMYQPQYRHQLCVVAGVDSDGNMVRVVNRNGQELSIEIAEGMDLAKGQFMIMVTNKFDNVVQFKMEAAQKAGDIYARFRNQLQTAQSEQVANRIGEAAQSAYERQMNTLESLQTQLQEQNRLQLAEAVGQAIEDAEGQYKQTLQLQEQIRNQIKISGNAN